MCTKRLFKGKVMVLVFILLITISIAGCGSSNKEMDTAAQSDKSMPLEAEVNGGFNNDSVEAKYSENSDDSGLTDTDVMAKRKIIQSAYIDLETKTFDATVDEIVQRTSIVGGYIESSNITGRRINYSGNSEERRASFRLRIPERDFEQFILDFGNIGNVISDRRDGQDITDRYFDTEARLKTLKIQEERLLEILKKADKVEDIIELERALADIRYNIENLTETLKKWDNLVSYATLEVNVYEVYEIKKAKQKPITFGQKIGNQFNESVDALIDVCKGLVIVFVALVPFLIIIIPVGLVIIYILRKNKNNKKI